MGHFPALKGIDLPGKLGAFMCQVLFMIGLFCWSWGTIFLGIAIGYDTYDCVAASFACFYTAFIYIAESGHGMNGFGPEFPGVPIDVRVIFGIFTLVLLVSTIFHAKAGFVPPSYCARTLRRRSGALTRMRRHRRQCARGCIVMAAFIRSLISHTSHTVCMYVERLRPQERFAP